MEDAMPHDGKLQDATIESKQRGVCAHDSDTGAIGARTPIAVPEDGFGAVINAQGERTPIIVHENLAADEDWQGGI